MKKTLGVLSILSLVFWSGTTAGYVRITTTTTGIELRWTDTPITYYINANGAPQIPNGSEFLAVHAAFDAWENVPSAAVDFDFGGTTPLRSVGRDGLNVITFADDSGLLGSQTLAATFSFINHSNGVLEESDIAFNPNHDFSTSGEEDKFDIQSVVTHEVGHMLGLDHSGVVSSVMGPFAAVTQVFQRVLQYDDIAGVSEIYPQASNSETVGSIEGRVQANGVGVFGAHVVVQDDTGTTLVGTLARPDGDYTLPFLPEGTYRVYAEPFDRPVSSEQLSGYYRTINTNFGTTYHGDVEHLAEARPVTVTAGTATMGTDIQVVPRSATSFNLTRPVFAPRIARGGSDTLRVGGVNVVDGATFSVSNPGIAFQDVTFGGRMSRTAPLSATMEALVSEETTLGPKSVSGLFEGATSVLTGVVVVIDPPPDEIEASPTSDSVEGGAVVTLTGRDFRTGVRVFFSGLPAGNVQFLNSGMLQVTVPENSPGPANIQVFNTDGTSGVLRGGFSYTSPPPTVSQVAPSSGPPSTLVTIDGSNFDIRSQNVEVLFNGQSGRIVSSTRTKIETVVPFGATTGSLLVKVFGVAVDAGTFTITEPSPSANTAPEVFTFIDATPAGGGTNVNFVNKDDAVHFTTIPFTFSLFKDAFLAGSPLSIATNGWLSLDGASTPEFQNASLPAQSSERPSGGDGIIPAAMIAPFFDDLTFESAGSVSTLLTGEPGARRYIVQWSDASILNSVGDDLEAALTFELVLYEGSNDVQFIYKSMSGTRSNGSSATIGMQNLSRDGAVQTGFNQGIVGGGVGITYRFSDGTYQQELSDQTPPSAPTVTDGGARTGNQGELFASWVSTDPDTLIREFEYAIGTTPGGTDVRAFTATDNNSVVATNLVLAEGATYYFAVRARSVVGLVSEPGTSDGIQVDTSFVPAVDVFPSVPFSATTFGGIALQANVQTDVVLRAVDIDGTLPMGRGVRNPTAVTLEAGQQWARLIPEIFGLTSFGGWFELEVSAPGLRTYMSTGRNDLVRFDAANSSAPSSDFFLTHAGANAILVNPSSTATTAMISQLGTEISQPLDIPARSRRTTPLSGPVRITSPVPIAAVEHFGSAEDLGIGNAVPAVPQTEIQFPHAAVGGGYRSWVTLANLTELSRTATVTFDGATGSVQVAANGTSRFSLGEVLGLSATVLRTGAVQLTTSSIFGSQAFLVGVIDIETDSSLVTLGGISAATEVLFPHVAHGNGFFTGVAIAAGSSATTVKIDVFPASSGTPKSATITVPANGQIARVISELVPEVVEQSGGYIRLTSDQPIWAWEIYGTHQAMASGPPG